jgi:hypothetical protein
VEKRVRNEAFSSSKIHRTINFVCALCAPR